MFYFFFSYARTDDSPYLRRFFRDLSEVVRLVTGDRAGAGFFDEGVGAGESWPAAVAEALFSSKTFVCALSPGYLNSVYAGRELEAFRRRLAPAPEADGRPLPLILPVCWEALERMPKLPPALADIQIIDADFGSTYRKEGLYQLMRLSRHRDEYKSFIHSFGRIVVDRADSFAHLLRGATPPSSLGDLPSAFEAPSPPPPRVEGQAAGGGPRVAKFVFVAGNARELRQVRADVGGYGEQGGMEWTPGPAAGRPPVGLDAQYCATLERYHYEALPPGDDLVERLREAEARNEIVILIVDPWTLCLGAYAEWMRKYDQYNFINSAVLVVWGEDEETAKNRHMLEDVVRMNFIRKLTLEAPYFRQVASPASLRKELAVVLSKLRRRLSERASVYRQVEDADDFPKLRVI